MYRFKLLTGGGRAGTFVPRPKGESVQERNTAGHQATVVLGVIVVVAGIVTGSVTDALIGLAICVGSLLLLKFLR